MSYDHDTQQAHCINQYTNLEEKWDIIIIIAIIIINFIIIIVIIVIIIIIIVVIIINIIIIIIIIKIIKFILAQRWLKIMIHNKHKASTDSEAWKCSEISLSKSLCLL
jgi:hypothetical protein